MYFEKRESKKAKKGYSWRVVINYQDPETGLTKRYSKSGFDTKAAAQKHGLEIEKELNDTGSVASDITIAEAYAEWLELNKDRLAKNTLSGYKNAYDHLAKIRNKPMKKIRYKELQNLFNGLDLCKGTKHIIKALLQNLFKYAIKNGYISNNPVPYVELTGKEKKPTEDALELHQIEDICDAIKTRSPFRTEAYKVFMWIGYYTGFRASEILALEWSDIDFENNSIHVWKRQEQKTCNVTERMKTKSSTATVPMCEPLKKILEEWHQENHNELLICTRKGVPVSYQTINNNLRTSAKKIGIVFHCHMLRHTFITNVVKSGADPKTAAQLARHSNVTMTLDIYTKMSGDDLAIALAKAYPPPKIPQISA